MFSTIQPGERLNDSSTGLEGERLGWAHKSPVFLLFFFRHPFRENNNLGSLIFAQNADTPICIQLPRLGFQQRP